MILEYIIIVYLFFSTHSCIYVCTSSTKFVDLTIKVAQKKEDTSPKFDLKNIE